MLYLGQALKFKALFDGQFYPGIFLGFKTSDYSSDKDAIILRLNDKDQLYADSVALDKVGFIKQPFAESPTGYRIFHGDTCKEIVDETIVLKWPEENLAKTVIHQAFQLMNQK